MGLSKLRTIILSDPDRCVKVRFLTIDALSDRLAQILQELGAFEVSEPRLEISRAKQLEKELEDIIVKGERILLEFLRRLPREQTIVLNNIPTPDKSLEILKTLVYELSRDLSIIEDIERRVQELKSRISKLKELKLFIEKTLSIIGDTSIDILEFNGKNIKSITIRVQRHNFPLLRNELMKLGVEFVLNTEVGNHVYTTIMFLSRIENGVRNILKIFNCETIELPKDVKTISELREHIAKKVDLLEKELSISQEVEKIIEKDLEKIALLKIILDNERERLKLLKKSLSTRYLAIVEGWVPQSLYHEVVERVHKEIGIVFVESVVSDEEPPVTLKNPKPLKPFEILTTLYGYPGKYEWDPTPILAYSFILFFALMLGDIGYAIGLLLATRFVLPKLVDNPESEGFKKLQKILYIVGFASLVVGAMSGCVFGSLDIWGFKVPKIIDVNDIGQLIVLSMIIGYIHVLIAHIIALFKNLKMHSIWNALNELGIVLIMLFGGIYALHVMNILPPENRLPDTVVNYIFAPMTYIALIIIIISKIKTWGGVGAVIWIFDITGPLGDVLSYVRIAGIALATVFLANAFNTMALMIESSLVHSLGGAAGIILGILASCVVLVMAHIFNLAMSSLGPFVHSLRLCLLEFASKFYEGTGKEFRPVKVVLSRYVSLKK